MYRWFTLAIIVLALVGCKTDSTYSEVAKLYMDGEIKRIRKPTTDRNGKREDMPNVLAHSLSKTYASTDNKPKLFNISANNVPAKKFFYTLSKQTNTNMVVDDKVEGNITFDLKQVSLDNILDLLSSVHDLYFRRVSGTIYIMPRRLETKIYTIQGLALKRRGSSSMTVSGGSETGDTSTSNATLMTEFDIQNIWSDIQQTITAIIDSDFRNYPQLQDRGFSYAE